MNFIPKMKNHTNLATVVKLLSQEWGDWEPKEGKQEPILCAGLLSAIENFSFFKKDHFHYPSI